MEWEDAVTVATGALGPVLAELTALVSDEYKKFTKASRSDIEFTTSALEPVHGLLLRIWEREDVDDACRDWMMAARDLSYDIEDMMSADRRGFVQGREASPFRDIKIQVERLVNQCDDKWKKTPGTSSNRSKPTMDARARFLHEDASELVGVGKHTEKLIGFLQKHAMVCVIGSAGMGKTTAADLVYRAIGEEFQCRAFVSLSPSPIMTEVLESIIAQVTNGGVQESSGSEAATEQHLVDNISNFLAGKRYLVVVDDIWHWEHWEIIRRAFPENSLGSKIIMTTRVYSIAEKCKEDAFIWVHQGIGNSDAWTLSEVIVKKSGVYNKLDGTGCLEWIRLMCQGKPLGIICLSTALAESLGQGQFKGCDTWKEHLLAGFLNIPSLKPLVESFSRDFDDLSLRLKTCLLYCTTYCTFQEIARCDLVRKWIAEGFVYQEEAGEAYFDELVSRNLLLDDRRNNLFQVHPLMLAYLVCKSKEANLVTHMHDYGAHSFSCNAEKRIQRLSIFYGRSMELSGVDVSHTRSLVSLGPTVPDPKDFGRLRVLHLENNDILENNYLVDICGLLCLRYLGIRSCPNVSMLPREIGRLQNLETLDVCGTKVTELPREASLLRSLVCVLVGGVKSPRVLNLSGGPFLEEDNTDLSSQANLWSIMLSDDHFISRVKPLPVKIAGRHVHTPQWIRASLRNVYFIDIMLCSLGEDDQKLLGELPNLTWLVVRFQRLPREVISIISGGFKRLENFCFDCRLPRVTFKSGAMPNLKLLEFKFYSGPASKDPVGVTHLSSIEEIVLWCSTYYRSDASGIGATIEVLRREAAEHPNEITLRINDKEPEVFPKKEVAESCDNIDSATISEAGVMEASLADNDNMDNKGKAVDVSSQASCSRASEIHEIEEAQQ